jgi:uncharacterized membrane protein YbhN (UPF0104 family)
MTMLLRRHPHSPITWRAGLGISALFAGAMAAFLLRGRLSSLLRRTTAWLLKRWVRDAPQRAAELEHALQSLLQQYRRVAGASFMHLVCWCGGGGNVWIAYHLLGARPAILDALAIESILSAVLAFGFLIPGALGVQELAYIGVGQLFGIPSHLSLALSLIRRTRDLLIGAPALLVWQALEARRLGTARHSASRRAPPPAAA